MLFVYGVFFIVFIILWLVCLNVCVDEFGMLVGLVGCNCVVVGSVDVYMVSRV